MIHWLLTNSYWLATQGIIQNSTIVLWAVAIAGYWVHRSCKAHRWCWRPGDHKVAGTTVSVCSRHHTLEHHRRLFSLHKSTGNRLAHGETHFSLQSRASRVRHGAD